MNIIDKILDLNCRYEQEIKLFVPQVEEYVKSLAIEFSQLDAVIGVEVCVRYDDSGCKELDVNVHKPDPATYKYTFSNRDYILSDALAGKIPQELSDILISQDDMFYFSIGEVDS
jgi:hypothetical protein